MKSDSPPSRNTVNGERIVVKGFASSENRSETSESGGESDKYEVLEKTSERQPETVKPSETPVSPSPQTVIWDGESGEVLELNGVKPDGTFFQALYDTEKTKAIHNRKDKDDEMTADGVKARIGWLRKAIGTRQSKIQRGEGNAETHKKAIDELQKELKKLLS